MKKTALSLVLFLLSVCGALAGQSFEWNKDRVPLVSLHGLWRFHIGDDPAWADPNFDDSHWALLRAEEDWGAQGYEGYSGVAWYRFRLVLPSNEQEHPGLLLPEIRTSYQVFANGSLIGGCGGMPPDVVGLFCHAQIYPLPQTSRTVAIALRVWQRPAWADYQGGGPDGPSYIGPAKLLRSQLELQIDAFTHAAMQYYFLVLLSLLGSLGAFALYLFRRNEWEYFWFGCMMLIEAAGHALELHSDLSPVGIRGFFLSSSLLEDLGMAFALAFYYVLLRGRRTKLFYAAVAGVALSFLGNFGAALPGMHDSAGSVNSEMLSTIVSLPLIIWVIALLIERAREKMVDARLLLAPVLLVYGDQVASGLAVITYQLGWQHHWEESFSLFSEPFPVDSHVMAEFLFLVAMMGILIHRFARTRSLEERYAKEFEAARSLQAMLVPEVAPSTPGFAVESVYLPAQEVGGDFFQISPGEDGSLLVVVGDVSGKGLKAALTVSTIIGALRGCPARHPAGVLAYMNRVLQGQVDGFVTCAAVFIGASGALTIANAGNLAPYLNGEELAVDSGLPLGILANIAYVETSYHLRRGDRLTFVSDGVVEATNYKRELFGFERTQAISHRTATLIAEAAKNFGQQDDVSVLSVMRTD